ncbi:gluconokinase [Nocardioides sp.]|nr:gluconokinase [Nocardioides sp.]
MHVVIMGVSGTGKSTVARGVAAALGLQVAEGDDFHPPANIAKMSAGIPLDDDDRGPWLAALARWAGERHAEATSTVLTCSALKRSYRDILRSGVPEPTLFVHLVGSREVLEQRMATRAHFMPVSLLDSQLATLQALEPDEDGLVVDTDQPVADVVAAVVSWLRRRPEPRPPVRESPSARGGLPGTR